MKFNCTQCGKLSRHYKINKVRAETYVCLYCRYMKHATIIKSQVPCIKCGVIRKRSRVSASEYICLTCRHPKKIIPKGNIQKCPDCHHEFMSNGDKVCYPCSFKGRLA